MTDRIQKVLAEAGLGGRRTIEAWIGEGRITVNGRPAEIGQKISHDDRVRVDGRSIKLSRKAETPRVLLYRKKTGEVSTRDDPDGRRTVFRKLPELESGRWIGVGRLDINTSGLLLMTTDGELARRLMHPSFEIERTYAVRVLGEVTDEIRQRLTTNVQLDDGPAKFVSMTVVDSPEADDAPEGGSANRWYEVTVKQGRNRVVRRLFEAVDLQVSRLIRIAYGPVTLGRGIKTGSYREATQEESAALYEAVGMATATPSPRKGSWQKDSPRRGAPHRGSPQKESRRKGASHRDSPHEESPRKGAPRRDSLQKDSPRKGGPHRDSSQKDSLHKGAPHRASPQKDSPRKGAPHSASPQSESPRKGAPRKGSPGRGSPRHGPTRRGSPGAPTPGQGKPARPPRKPR